MSTNLQGDEISGFSATHPRNESVAPAVSWAAIFAGANAAAEAQNRVDQVISTEKAAESKARQAADEARKAAAAASIFTALSMLIGAFIACASAALGGRLRDLHP